MTSDISTSSSCRIIIVSQSLETSHDVAHRIKSIAGDESEAQSAAEIIPWTIQNRYYTAPVHFHPIHLELLPVLELEGVPAVIYAWKEKEPYQAQLKTVAEHLAEYEPEILLAIGLSPLGEGASEETFFEYGFEYVDGRDASLASAVAVSASESSEAPGLRRAVDALSTIMWPSMVRVEGTRAKGSRGLLDLSASSEEVDADFAALLVDADGKSARQREMEALERWLEEEADEADEAEMEALGYANMDDDDSASEKEQGKGMEDDPWATAALSGRAGSTGPDGFDDDFTDFVSMPPLLTPTGSAQAGSTSEPQPSSASLNSNLDSDLDPELPSTAEVQAASERIFGKSLQSQNQRGGGLDDFADENDPVFDLSRVFGALQGIKAEIASMPDERARRTAAAKAALGLVYGLEGTAGELDFDFNSQKADASTGTRPQA